MELLIKNSALYIGIALTGLSAGLFYAWEFSVIPGTKQLADRTYLETMQSINRAIQNLGFFIIFMGSLLMLIAACFSQYSKGITPLLLIIAATVSYLIGTIGVTVFGNVPMNETLDAIDLTNLNDKALKSIRAAYEGKWNRLHTIRTVFSVIAFLLALLTVFANTRPTIK